MGRKKGKGGAGGPNQAQKRGPRSSTPNELDPAPSSSMNLSPVTRRSQRIRRESVSPSRTRTLVGPSGKRISRAEAIQLEADAIPSTSTSDWNPYTVFPKEIWTHIFDYLSNPKDMENAMNATPEWNELYFNKRTTLLFDSVLAIMADKGPRDVLGGKFPSSEKYLEREDYLNCRLVCQTWNQSVQNYLQMHRFHFELDPLRDEEDLKGYDTFDQFNHQVWQETDQFAWPFPEILEEQTEEMVRTHPPERNQNPFLTRRLTLQDVVLACPCCHRPERTLEIARRWWSSIPALLEKYGNHVWHCKINFHRNMTLLTWHSNIQHWINLMPNLKSLNLMNSLSRESLRRRDLSQLEDQIAISPFPNLENLVALKVVNVPALVFNDLVSKTPNLKKLQVRMNGKGVRLSQYNLNLIRSDLSEAYLTMVASEDFLHLESSTICWPLKTLYFHLEFENRELGTFRKWPDWSRTFKMLEEKFGSTLTELKLRLPMATRAADKKKILNDCLGYRLNLPHLKKLRIVVPNLTSFDFILPFKNTLEELTLIVDHCESGDKVANALKRQEILKINGNFSRLFKSNVWSECPKLKRIDLFILGEPTAPRDKDYCFYGYIRHTYDKETGVHTDHDALRYSGRSTITGRRTRQSNDNICRIA